MYEKMTYESILQKMLNMVSDDVDKREGSIIYDALAPAAYFLADQFFQLDNFVDLLLPDTALGIFRQGCWWLWNYPKRGKCGHPEGNDLCIGAYRQPMVN